MCKSVIGQMCKSATGLMCKSVIGQMCKSATGLMCKSVIGQMCKSVTVNLCHLSRIRLTITDHKTTHLRLGSTHG